MPHMPVPDKAAAATGNANAFSEAAVRMPGFRPLEAAEAFADELAAGQVPTIRAIRSRVRIGQTRAQHVRAHLPAFVSESRKAA
jgi:hypothetical protein